MAHTHEIAPLLFALLLFFSSGQDLCHKETQW